MDLEMRFQLEVNNLIKRHVLLDATRKRRVLMRLANKLAAITPPPVPPRKP